MKDDAKLRQDRDRWNRNKKAQRARQRAAMLPSEPSAGFLMQVEAERIERGSTAAYNWARKQSSLNYWTSSGRHIWIRKRFGHWHKFVADVWAATVEIEARLGKAKTTPSRIALLLAEKKQLHGYNISSVRIRIYQARETIAAFETAAREHPEAQFWLAFNRRCDDQR